MRKFKIPAVPPTTNKSIRFPNDVISQVEEAIRGKDCTFSAFVRSIESMFLLQVYQLPLPSKTGFPFSSM